MTYEEAREYIGQVSKTGSILGLDSIGNLMEELENVQDKLSVIHIAGTNGKGSTGAYMESVLIEAGKKVGRYTSPAVFEPLEVWRINRENISKEDYVAILTQVKMACERMVEKGMAHPTVFEVETAMAFFYFYEKKCDYVLLEVGMGGITDATNLIKKPVCSVITSISMDHMQFLGNTLGEIAAAKAGIIKEECPVVCLRQTNEVMQVIQEEARKKNAILWTADADHGQVRKLILKAEKEELFPVGELPVQAEATLLELSFCYPGIGRLRTTMAGSYQLENAYLATVVLHEVLHIPAETIREGIEKTKWPGRFEIASTNPLVILDGAHNEDAAEKLAATVRNYFTNKKITYIIGVLADKEHEKMLKMMLPLAERVYTVTPHNARAMDAVSLAEEALKYHNNVTACESIQEACEKALTHTAKEDVILAFGSLSYLGELKQEIKRHK